MAANNISAVFPDWLQLNFSSNCTAYGQWLSAFVSPNPWSPQDALGGSIPLSLALFTGALPANWTFVDGSNATAVVTAGGTPGGSAYFGDVMQWFTTHLFYQLDPEDQLWYAEPAFVDHVIWTPAEKCPREFCKAIAFTGNADLSGIGVVVSYYIEASLTTLYLVLFSAWRLRRWHRRRRRRWQRDGSIQGANGNASASGGRRRRPWTPAWLRRVFDAFRGCLDSFLTAASVLALAILVAAVVTSTRRTSEHHRNPVNAQNIPNGSALYDGALSLLVSIYAVFPVMVLYALLPDDQMEAESQPEPDAGRGPEPETKATTAPTPKPPARRRCRAAHAVIGLLPVFRARPRHATHSHRGRIVLRRAVLVVLWALVAAVVFLDPRSEIDYEYQGESTPDNDTDNNNFADVLYACDQRGGRRYWHTLGALRYFVMALPLVWLLLTAAVDGVAGCMVKRQPKQQQQQQQQARRHARAVSSVWQHAVAWVNCALMWAVLACLTEMRQNIIEVADGLDTENEWKFGQVMAIATWGPVASDFFFLLMCMSHRLFIVRCVCSLTSQTASRTASAVVCPSTMPSSTSNPRAATTTTAATATATVSRRLRHGRRRVWRLPARAAARSAAMAPPPRKHHLYSSCGPSRSHRNRSHHDLRHQQHPQTPDQMCQQATVQTSLQ